MSSLLKPINVLTDNLHEYCKGFVEEFDTVANPITRRSMVRELALIHFDRHLDRSWTFQMDTRKNRLGVCNHSERLIGFSAHVADNCDGEVCVDVIRHECAHAICGPGYGHGPTWRTTALAVGATPEECYSGGRFAPPSWMIACTCGMKLYRYMTPNLQNRCCGRCGNPALDKIKLSTAEAAAVVMKPTLRGMRSQ